MSTACPFCGNDMPRLLAENTQLLRIYEKAVAVLGRFDLDAKQLLGTEAGDADNAEVKELRDALKAARRGDQWGAGQHACD